ncbi:hypothetical protein H5410_024547 [Solanum commersonii]|uniref:Uncharacterized protein n=1 Tax=Solanum commersonii TaxID=4109 RepID=A0A9J5ZMC2_SOLCO|nr:hypothetical protein H5410_024547 [Solanum commersonii]
MNIDSESLSSDIRFCLLRRSSLVGAVQQQGFVVVVDLVVRTERRGEEENGVLLVVWVLSEAATVVADGRAAKEGEQMKALAMPLMEVN